MGQHSAILRRPIELARTRIAELDSYTRINRPTWYALRADVAFATIAMSWPFSAFCLLLFFFKFLESATILAGLHMMLTLTAIPLWLIEVDFSTPTAKS